MPKRIDEYAAVTTPALTALLLLETLPDDPVNRAYNGLTLASLKTLFGIGGPMTIQGTVAELGPTTPGAELLDGTGWTSTGWTGSFAADFTHTTGNSNPLSRTITGLTAGQLVKLVFTKTATGSGTFAWTTNGVTQTTNLSGSVPSTLTRYMYSLGTDITFSLTPASSSTTFAFGSFSAKIVTSTSPAITLKDSNGVEGTHFYAANATRSNTSIGYTAGQYLDSTGAQNTLLGYQAGAQMILNLRSIAIGYQSQAQSFLGSDNISIGFQSLVAVGAFAGFGTAGNSNIAIGSSSLHALTTGNSNTSVGLGTGLYLTTGSSNTLIGSSAGEALTTASNNTLIGASAGVSITTGINNVFVGCQNFSTITTGHDNTFIGYGATNTPPSTGGATNYFTNISNLIYGDGTIGCVMIGTSLSYSGIGILQLPVNGSGAKDGGIAFGLNLTLTQGPALGTLRLIAGQGSNPAIFQVYNEIDGDAVIGFRVTTTPQQYELRVNASDQSFSIIDVTDSITRFKIESGGAVQLSNLGAGAVYSDASGYLSNLTVGSSLSLTGDVLNAIQDIRTTALPQFAGLGIRSSGAAFNVTLASAEVGLTANRTLFLAVGNAARTLTLSGNPTLGDWFDQSVKVAATPVFASLTAGGIKIVGNQIFEAATNANTSVAVNYSGYASGTTQFRDFVVFDGKNNSIFSVIGASGNVGIGGTPGAKFEISQASAGANIEAIRLRNTGTTASTGASIDFHVGASAALRSRIAMAVDAGGVGTIGLYTGVGTTLGLFQDSSGNVGIGMTPASTARLHVNGRGTTSGTYGLVVQNTSAQNVLLVRDDGVVTIGIPASSIFDASGNLSIGGTITSAIPGGGVGLLMNASTGTANTGSMMRWQRGGTNKWDMGTGIAVGGDFFELYSRVGNFSAFQINPSTGATTFVGDDTFAGRIGFGVAPNSNLRMYVAGQGTTSSTYSVVFTDSALNWLFHVRDDGSVGIDKFNTFTSGSAANMYADGSGIIYKSTSSARYKKNIVDYSRGLTDLLKLRPVFYEGIAEVDTGKTFAGLIAEEVEAAGLTEYVTYDSQGRPDALQYSQMVALLISAIKEMSAEIKSLKGA